MAARKPKTIQRPWRGEFTPPPIPSGEDPAVTIANLERQLINVSEALTQRTAELHEANGKVGDTDRMAAQIKHLNSMMDGYRLAMRDYAGASHGEALD